MKRFRKKSSVPGYQGGYSLIELIVSAGIISLTIISLVVVLRKGKEISITGQHRMRARAVIDSCFESSTYHYENYANIDSLSSSVMIDPRDESITTDDLSGIMDIAVTLDTNTLIGQGSRDSVEFKQVSISVSWAEPETTQTIRLEKMITDIW